MICWVYFTGIPEIWWMQEMTNLIWWLYAGERVMAAVSMITVMPTVLSRFWMESWRKVCLLGHHQSLRERARCLLPERKFTLRMGLHISMVGTTTQAGMNKCLRLYGFFSEELNGLSFWLYNVQNSVLRAGLKPLAVIMVMVNLYPNRIRHPNRIRQLNCNAPFSK